MEQGRNSERRKPALGESNPPCGKQQEAMHFSVLLSAIIEQKKHNFQDKMSNQ
jgi:hypothetical protein